MILITVSGVYFLKGMQTPRSMSSCSIALLLLDFSARTRGGVMVILRGVKVGFWKRCLLGLKDSDVRGLIVLQIITSIFGDFEGNLGFGEFKIETLFSHLRLEMRSRRDKGE